MFYFNIPTLSLTNARRKTDDLPVWHVFEEMFSKFASFLVLRSGGAVFFG